MKRPSRSVVRVGVVAAVVIAAAGVGSVVTAAAYPTSRVTTGQGTVAASAVSTKDFPSGKGNPGIFTERCGYSHEAPDDPIMMPRRTGMSMHHDFFGNTGTDADSTASSLVGGATTCRTSADASGYWIPVMYQNGKAVTPRSALIYWRRPRRDTDAVRTVPAGLQMVAGNAMATAPSGTGVVAWKCARVPKNSTAAKATASPHSCPAGGMVKETVFFPSCWDGKTLSGNSRENVVYRTRGGGGCPSSHPVQIPQIVFHVVYPTASASGIRLSLTLNTTASSDSAHADFLNGWNQSVLDSDVSACIATSTRCGPVSGPKATPQGPNKREQKRLAHKNRDKKQRTHAHR